MNMISNADLTAGVQCTPARRDPSTAPSFSKVAKMDWKNEPSTETPLEPCISWSCCCKEFQTDGKFVGTVIPLAAPRTMAVIRETYRSEERRVGKECLL